MKTCWDFTDCYTKNLISVPTYIDIGSGYLHYKVTLFTYFITYQ